MAVHYDILFHSLVFEKCENYLLKELWDMVCKRIEFIQSYTKQGNFSMKLRHGEMICAIEQKDFQMYKACLIHHLDTSNMNFRASNDEGT